jgi:hypothetical protein
MPPFGDVKLRVITSMGASGASSVNRRASTATGALSAK